MGQNNVGTQVILVRHGNPVMSGSEFGHFLASVLSPGVYSGLALSITGTISYDPSETVTVNVGKGDLLTLDSQLIDLAITGVYPDLPFAFKVSVTTAFSISITNGVTNCYLIYKYDYDPTKDQA